MATKTGVYPVYENQFQVGATKEALTDIADMESFSVKLDNGVEEWNPLDQKGWVRRLMTSKSVTISISGKRNFGDTGNDYVAGLALKNGRDVEGCLTNWGAGKSTEVIPLEFDVMSNGKPTYTEASPQSVETTQAVKK